MDDPKNPLPAPVAPDPTIASHPAVPDPAAGSDSAGPFTGVSDPIARAGAEPGGGQPEPAKPLAVDAGVRPSFIFFGVVAALSLLADVTTKAWAEIVLSERTLADPSIVIIEDHLGFRLAYNKAGAWGLLAGASEAVRRPFFLVVSVAAILFIVSLYGRLMPGQRALKWGLPLVLGGALGNLSDRITRQGVIDFIDYRADWVESMNRAVASIFSSWSVTDHWPTFNVADISICIGVGLMAVDMVTSHRAGHGQAPAEPSDRVEPGSDRVEPSEPIEPPRPESSAGGPQEGQPPLFRTELPGAPSPRE